MAAIPEQIIERIREQVDIVDVVGGHVGLKRSGKQYKGLCPFHDEKSPSFYVDPVRRSFKCFGCGAWGDVFDFIQKVEGVGFLSAVRTLGARLGIALPDQNDGDVRRAEERERERELAYRVNAAAAELFRELLLHAEHGAAGRAYQSERGIDEQTSEAFRIGYAPAPEEAGWDTLVRELQRRDLPLDMADKLGLVARSQRSGSYFDRFRGRLMFPIIQPGGRVLGFSGRILPRFAEAEDGQKAPKYVNSPESLLYKKSRTLFGIHSAGSVMRTRERGILVEGQIDVVSMHQRGYTETVAPLGTALTKPQCELLARFTNQIVLCFDGDRAGAKAAYAAMPLLLEAGMDVRIAPLPDGEDPDSIAPEHLANLMRAPGSALEWLMKRMVAKGARQSIDAQAKALRALVPLLRAVRGRDARGDYCNRAAEMLGVPARRVWSAVERGESGERAPSRGPRPAPAQGAGPGPRRQADPRRQANPRRQADPRWQAEEAPPPWMSPPPELMDGPPHFAPDFAPDFPPDFAPDFPPDFVGPADAVAHLPRSARAVGPVSAGPSQFFAGMPHSAAMRAVQPLPSGQASVTALLVDRPELARVAEREGVLDRVTDQRLQPIIARVIRAALQGDNMPSEGELLELVDPTQHRMLHDKVFGHSYLEVEDPQAVLEQGLVLCEQDMLELEIRALEGDISEARARGDDDSVRELTVKRMETRQRREQLKKAHRRH